MGEPQSLWQGKSCDNGTTSDALSEAKGTVSEKQLVKVEVKSLTGSSCQFVVQPTTSIGAVKSDIEAGGGPTVYQQRLILCLGGSITIVLLDDQTIAECMSQVGGGEVGATSKLTLYQVLALDAAAENEQLEGPPTPAKQGAKRGQVEV